MWSAARRLVTFDPNIALEVDPPSSEVCQVRRIFGITGGRRPVPILKDVEIHATGITFITGFSGAGKSTLLRTILADRIDARQLPGPPPPEAAPIAIFKASVSECMQWLGRFGLGEALVMTTPTGLLSDGEMMRLRLAMLLWDKPSIVVIDEFLSVLDHTTASMVAFNFQRICRKQGVTAYLASAHEHVVQALAPDHLIRLDLNGGSESTSYPSPEAIVPELKELTIASGTRAQFEQLSRFHYATDQSIDWSDERLKVQVVLSGRLVVGAAIYAPPLHSSFDGLPFLRRLNETVITLVRTVIHPVYRGVGLTQILQPNLAPETRLLSSFSAFGRYVPFRMASGFLQAEHPRCKRRPEHDALDALISALWAGDPTVLYDSAAAQSFLDSLDLVSRSAVRSRAAAILVQDNTEYCIYLARAAELPVSDQIPTQLANLFQQLLARVPDSDLGLLLAEAFYFPMQGFVKRIG